MNCQAALYTGLETLKRMMKAKDAGAPQSSPRMAMDEKFDNSDEDSDDSVAWPPFLTQICYFSLLCGHFSMYFMSNPPCGYIQPKSMSDTACGRNRPKNPRSDRGADINGRNFCGHKCPKMAILDRTSDSI